MMLDHVIFSVTWSRELTAVKANVMTDNHFNRNNEKAIIYCDVPLFIDDLFVTHFKRCCICYEELFII